MRNEPKIAFIIIVIVGFLFFTFVTPNIVDIETLEKNISDNEAVSLNESDNFINKIKDMVTESPIEKQGIYSWYGMPIKYYYDEENMCTEKEKNDIEEAFRIITEKTNSRITYLEEESEHGIKISCYNYSDGGTAGQAGFKYYSDNYRIDSATIEFFNIDSRLYYDCTTYPNTEIHETLHTLGIGHITNRTSVMNPTTNENNECAKLDDEIVDCLNYIYSNGNETFSCENINFMK